MNNCVPRIQQAYMEAGFPKLGVLIHVDDELQDRMAEEFVQKEQQIEQEFNEAQKAAQLAASQAPQKKSGAPASSKPEGVIYGKPIKSNSEVRALADIFEEERNVVIEGKIF